MRTPDEILNDLDEIQELVNAGIEEGADVQGQFTVRDLVWQVITDLLDSLGKYSTWDFSNNLPYEDVTPAEVVRSCRGMLTDYVVNAYGDD